MIQIYCLNMSKNVEEIDSSIVPAVGFEPASARLKILCPSH